MQRISDRLVIAIDGPAGAGKSTVAKELALRLGYLHIDSGAMYRALTHKLLQSGVDLHNGEAVAHLAARTQVRLEPMPGGPGNRVYVDGVDVTDMIRSQAVSQAVPLVSQYPAVRASLLEQQRSLARQGGVVMDGRDIGTVVLPDADVKIFLTASLHERAVRRQKEMIQRGVAVDTASVAKDIAARDVADSTRAVSPLVQAPDALLVDTTNLPVPMVVEQIYAICEQRLTK